jgi:hypothetical protein
VFAELRDFHDNQGARCGNVLCGSVFLASHHGTLSAVSCQFDGIKGASGIRNGKPSIKQAPSVTGTELPIASAFRNFVVEGIV